jgi:L-ascorbate 6-phosphate lactonase
VDLFKTIRQTKVQSGEVAIIWLGQAGFVFKDSDGHIVAVDPYLTDYCERVVGFKRIMPRLIAPEEIHADVLISTHDHADHFDADAMPGLMTGDTLLVGAPSSVAKAKEMGCCDANLRAVRAGDTIDLGWCRITAVYADHGDLAPDAVGVVIELEGISIYYVGDTAYRPDKMEQVMAMKPDVIIPPINGEYGNLDAREAVLLAKDVGAKLAIPCHFWMFAMHKGDPQQFLDEAEKHLAPHCEYGLMCQGEVWRYARR